MQTKLPLFPPFDGSLTILPGFIEWQAEHNPDRLCFLWPSSVSPDGTQGVTNQEFNDAMHRVAHILRPRRAGPEGEVVGLLMHTDTILYGAICAGMAKAGMVFMPMSPRNSAAAVVNLLEKTGCHRIIANSAVHSLLDEVRSMLTAKGYPLDVLEMPGLYDAFPLLQTGANGHPVNGAHSVEPYPPPHEKPKMEDIMLYIHSSGSTGLPKPIPWTHKLLLLGMSRPIFKDGGPLQVQWAAMALPIFHAFGFVFQFVLPFLTSCPVGLYEPKYPAPPVVPTVDNLLEAARLTKCTAMPTIPVFIEMWARDPEVVKYLATQDVVMYAGGPLAKKSGDELVAAGVKLLPIYGGTEFGCPTLAFYNTGKRGDIRTLEDWEWMQFDTEAVDVRFIPQGDGSYELQVLVNDTHIVAVENLPDTRGYATSDLWVPHPTKEGLWRISGRLDDVLVLSNAEKIVPIPQEGHISTSPMVAGAVMFGHGREQAGILIEPTPKHAIDPNDQVALVNFRNALWPTVEQANHAAPAFGRIFKEMVLVAHPSKPLPRAGKGTVIRKQAWAAYHDEIEQLYQTVEDTAGTRDITPPRSWGVADLEPWVLAQATYVNDDKPVDSQRDLFEQGFDSLSATFFRNRIIGALRAAKQANAAAEVSQNFVFENPTVQRLAQAIAALVDPASTPAGPVVSPATEIEDMIAKYSADMPSRSATGGPTRDGVVVFLTGATGGIGSHILAALLADDRISRVYAFNRGLNPDEARGRQSAAFRDRGLPTELLSGRKYVALVGDLNEKRFGLAEDVFEEVVRSVTVVIHNAWMVHFNHPLHSFENLIAGTRKLIDWCISLSRPVRFLYTSSVAVAQAWNIKSGPIPEVILPDVAVAIGSGYGASKYVVERILAVAREKGLEATVLRVGQVCGSTDTGAWSTNDWVPSMIKSSVTLALLPDTPGPVTWIPMDAVANLASELAASEKPAPLVLNLVHPNPTSWRAILGDVNSVLGDKMKFVPLEQWVSALEEKAAKADRKAIEELPAIKLLQTFRAIATGAQRAKDAGVLTEASGLPLFETTQLQSSSPAMRDLPPLGRTHADAWVKYWKALGYLA